MHNTIFYAYNFKHYESHLWYVNNKEPFSVAWIMSGN